MYFTYNLIEYLLKMLLIQEKHLSLHIYFLYCIFFGKFLWWKQLRKQSLGVCVMIQVLDLFCICLFLYD